MERAFSRSNRWISAARAGSTPTWTTSSRELSRRNVVGERIDLETYSVPAELEGYALASVVYLAARFESEVWLLARSPKERTWLLLRSVVAGTSPEPLMTWPMP